MSVFALIALAFGMSMDAFSAAIAKGTTMKHINAWRAIKYGLIFGLMEAVAPIIGWIFGHVSHQWIQTFDHWIAFVLLVGLGLRCFYEALFDRPEPAEFEPKPTTTQGGFWLIVTAFSTSIDAMVVGVSLAFLQVNICLAALLIGLVSAVMSALGLYLGRHLGQRFGKVAMIIGGMALMGIGSTILYSHLTG